MNFMITGRIKHQTIAQLSQSLQSARTNSDTHFPAMKESVMMKEGGLLKIFQLLKGVFK